MSEANSVTSMLTYSLKNLFRGGQEFPQPSREEVSGSGHFEKTLSDLASTPREPSVVSEFNHESGNASQLHADSKPASHEMAYESNKPMTSHTPTNHSTLTWQLVSSTTDMEHNGDRVQTAALPLKGYRIYSQAAHQGD
ncbi:MAG: hypothetical protein HQL84_01335 [Magnetococcales bacterium]|nr:hypothetical protein [Magnetococcales bacterium]MBF0148671.1 hypothetical protein [Magnetococcales bacterium]MBF0174102.1 hypothetical protein [Magnetococcales bacterium]MBF0349180.1 hypothetical protein [Magnetococcales bacterium]MBF0631477.1 hypothetical protein [Magnetococcales bacterium]